MRAAFVLAILLTATSAQAANRFNRQRVYDDLSYRLEQLDERRPLAVEAITSMLTFAGARLTEEGRRADADRIKGEWTDHYRAIVAGDVVEEDAGDHLPWNDWLALVYQLLENQFGIDYMEWSHLRDIWVLNFTLPVVFNPRETEVWCSEQHSDHPTDTCKREYARHLVGTYYDETGVDPYNTARKHHGFAGVVAYWATWTACEIVTYGSGWFLICMPAGNIMELSIEIFVAPRVSDAIWDRNNSFMGPPNVHD